MKRSVCIISSLFLIFLILAIFTGSQVTAEDKHKGHGTAQPQKVENLDMKGLTMDAIQKEGKMVELAPGSVQISPERQQLIGVKTGRVEVKSINKTIRATGKVDYDERRLAMISPKVGGWVEDLYVEFTGAMVKKGDPLLTIYSPELVSTQEEYLIALGAKENFIKSPFPEVVSSGNALVESAKRRLKLWDISEDQIAALETSGQPKKTLTLYSPYEGFVLERMVYRGMNVSPGMALFKLADLSVVWVNADIYENEISFIRLGQSGTVRLPYSPGETLTGKAIYIYPSLDPRTRTVKVRFEFPNRSGSLKPEMFANVEIKVDLGKRVAVPEGAIIDTGLRQIAIVDKGQGQFEPREVTLGVKVDDDIEVTRGLKPGERVVTSANFLIDSESKLREAIKSMAGTQHGTHGR